MARKITVKSDSQLPEVFKNPEFARYADELLGVISRHFRMIEGKIIDKDEQLKIATKILKERLND